MLHFYAYRSNCIFSYLAQVWQLSIWSAPGNIQFCAFGQKYSIWQIFRSSKSLFCFYRLFYRLLGRKGPQVQSQNANQKFKLVMTPTLPNKVPNYQLNTIQIYDYTERSIPLCQSSKIFWGRWGKNDCTADEGGLCPSNYFWCENTEVREIKTVKVKAKFKRIQK